MGEWKREERIVLSGLEARTMERGDDCIFLFHFISALSFYLTPTSSNVTTPVSRPETYHRHL